jgi:hypothetical protein
MSIPTIADTDPQPQAFQKAGRHVAIVCAASFGVIALHFLFLFVFPHFAQFPQVLRRTWGFHFITYYSVPVRIEFYLLAAIVCIPASNRLCWEAALLMDSSNLRNVVSRNKELVFVSIAAAAIPLFWLLRSKYAFLGDNFIRVDNVIRNDYIRDEPGAVWLLHYFYTVLHACFSLDGVTVFQVFDCLCGGAFVYLALRIADALGSAAFEKVSIFLFYCGFGTMYHFCGYIEIYSLPVVLFVAYLYASLLSIRGKVHYAVPAIVMGVACVCHLISLIFLPSFLAVIYESKLRQNPFFRRPLAWILVGAGAALILLLGYPHMAPRFYPLFAKGKGPMAMFSFVHVWEYCNGLLLSCGPALLIGSACLAYAALTKKRLAAETWFLLAASACIAAGLFAFNEIYGSGDWDIYSFSSLPVNLAAIFLFFQCFGDGKHSRFSRYAVVVFLGFMVLHSAPWILINASDKSIGRYEDCIMSDPASYYIDHPAPMKIGMAFDKYKLPGISFEYYKMAYEKDSTDPRNKYNYAVALLKDKNQLAMSTKILEKLCDDAPGYVPPLQLLVQIAQNTKNADLMFKGGMRLVELFRTKKDLLIRYYSQDEIMGVFGDLAELLLYKKETRLAEQVCNIVVNQCLNTVKTVKDERARGEAMAMLHQLQQDRMSRGEAIKTR